MYHETKWPIGVSLLSGESLASWFARLAWAHSVTPSELYRITLQGGRIGGIDLDRHACDDLVETASQRTGIPSSALQAATLRRWRGTVFEADDGKRPITWLPPAGRAYSRSSFGQQVCPACLAADPIPHYRLEWRLSFVTACAKHRILLVDRCPACSSPIGSDLGASSGSLAACWSCGFDLRAIATKRITEGELGPQTRLLHIAEGDWQKMGDYGPVHPILFFRVFALLYRLVASGRYALPLRQWLTGSAGEWRAESIPRIREIERHPTRVRHILTSMAWQLAQDWPHRFVAACDATGTHRWLLFKSAGDVPFFYAAAVTQYLTRAQHHVDAMEVSAAARQLAESGQTPTYKALRQVLGVKFHAARNLAEPSKPHKPYGTHRYWKLDGVSAATRAAAKKAAHQAGENLGAWVDAALRAALQTVQQGKRNGR